MFGQIGYNFLVLLRLLLNYKVLPVFQYNFFGNFRGTLLVTATKIEDYRVNVLVRQPFNFRFWNWLHFFGILEKLTSFKLFFFLSGWYDQREEKSKEE